MSEGTDTGQGRHERVSALLVLASTSGVVLFPYLTVKLGPQAALYVQAGGMLALTAVAATAAFLALRWPSFRDAGARPLLLGVGCYTACAVIGGLAGVVRGSETALLAGQVFAMGILPVAALALWPLDIRGTARILSGGIAGAAAVVALAHIASWLVSLLQHQVSYRMYFGNNVSVLGPSLLATLLGLALRAAPGAQRRLGGAAAVVLSAVIVGAGARSLWLVAPVALGIFLVASGLGRRALRGPMVLRFAAAVLLIAAVVGTVSWYVEKPRPNLVPDTTFSGPFWRFPPGATAVPDETAASGRALEWAPADDRPIPVTDAFPIKGNRAYLLRVSLRSGGGGESRVFLWFEDASGTNGYTVLRAGAASGWFDAEQSGVSTPSAVRARIAVSLKHGGEGSWRMRRISVEELGPPVLSAIHHQRAFWSGRIASLMRLNPSNWRQERSFKQRFGETGRLLQIFRAAPVATKLFGHGLGARFDFKTRREARPNYIHNFYAFLLYKTGIVGTALVLAAMSLWIGFTFVAARRARDPWRRAFLWAVFSAWLGYAAWSLACPEILDFRMAPLWGFVIAVTGHTDREEREAQAKNASA
jgi:hypothetical protein